MNVEEIPVPPQARAGSIEGRYEVGLDAATNTILAELKKNYSNVGEKILFLPAETDAADIFAFYEPKMTEKGFSGDESVPPEGKNYRQRVWRKDGWFGGEAAAVAVIDAGRDAQGQTVKFLAVFSAQK